MTRLLLGILVSGAAATVALLLTSWVAAATWRIGAHHVADVTARTRARILACWRLAPSAIALAIFGLAFTAFARFEPYDPDERIGVLIPLLAASGAVLATAGMLRAAHAWHRTRRSVRRWHAAPAGIARALPILAVDVPFPLVAVVGVWRPRLYVARHVFGRCDSRELDAMIAHEAAHVEAGDNLTRLLFVGAPIVPFVSGAAAEIERAWVAASEEAADDAARRDEESALALASAITKVARLATGSTPRLYASAILSGSGVEHRVRRLLASAPLQPARRSRAAFTGWLVIAMLVASSPAVLRDVYEVAEYCVRTLP